MKRISILGSFLAAATLSFVDTSVMAGAQQSRETIPNVLLVRIPAESGKVPTAENWIAETKVDFITLKLEKLPMTAEGNVDGATLASMCQLQQPSQVSIALSTSGRMGAIAPQAVLDLFDKFEGQSSDASNNWYFYHPHNNNYGFYGYGHIPYYGYFGASASYPYYGMYYNGYTYPYYASYHPYWYGGYYYYPYYHSW